MNFFAQSGSYLQQKVEETKSCKKMSKSLLNVNKLLFNNNGK